MRVSFFGSTYSKKPDADYHINDVLSRIKFGDWKNEILHIRKLKSKTDQDKSKFKLPNFTVSGTFSECADKNLIEHSGLIQIDIDDVNTPELREKLHNDKYIYSLFVSPRGNGLKGIVKIPAASHRNSFDALEKYFYDYYNVKIDKSCKNVSRRFYVSYDPELYLNEHSEVFAEIADTVNISGKQFQTGEINRDDFRSAIQSIRPKQPEDKQRDLYNKLIWAVNTVLGESEAVSFGKTVLANSRQLNDLDSIIKSQKSNTDHPEFVFRIAENHGWINPKKKSGRKKTHLALVRSEGGATDGNTALKTHPFNDSASNKYSKIRIWLQNRYNFRRNILTEIVDMCERSSETWKPASDIEVNDFIQAMAGDEIECSENAINIVLNSSFAPSYNPIREYFESLNINDIDPLYPDQETEKLFELLTGKKRNDCTETFEAFKTWLCAHAGISVDEIDKVDQLYCLCFYGAQGTGKTSLTRYFLPKQLDSYFKENLTDYESKDTKISLGENFLIQLDELGESSKHELIKLKSLITQKKIKERRPHAKRDTYIQRRAAFIGSFDKREVFDDSAGNRRFIVLEIQKIDWKKLEKISIDDIWKESLYCYRKGEFSKTIDQANISKNADFEKRDIATEAIQHCYDLTIMTPNEYYTSTQILSFISENMRLQGLTVHKIGSALSRLGFKPVTKRIGGSPAKVYPIQRRQLTEIGNQIRFDDV
ncbi:MAG TPA: VapE family protein [Leptospiraceae bacterium]|nr:VapE family protein [Leptospiraceae bacterium]